MAENIKKAIIAMSGGVDSSVAALLAKRAGWDCTGVTMKLFGGGEDEPDSKCCSADDTEDARAVANRLGIPFYVFNFKREFKEGVIDRFTQYYLCGRTPNPCIDCNSRLKFGKLFARADELGVDYVVTGHYARTEYDASTGKWLLKRAVNTAKDQSYVLYRLTQEQLARVRFPLGALSKDEVRRIAEENGFANAHKPDSQDICFIPDGDVFSAIRRYSGVTPQPGDFINTSGKVIGRHEGICKYTVGQRKGLGIAAGEPLYVRSINAADNTVELCRGDELYSRRAQAKDINWCLGDAPRAPFNCGVRIRYRAPVSPAVVTPADDGTVIIEFESPQRAVTPGQAAVFYDGETVLGGGELV
ncbi:MAG: tRNA 2-thiouridine(34) synthase MnmA [Clostridia bacterium]|nr:tRNA 2-thiouridine(34) synthase MnmA [Clostridia bacterium]